MKLLRKYLNYQYLKLMSTFFVHLLYMCSSLMHSTMLQESLWCRCHTIKYRLKMQWRNGGSVMVYKGKDGHSQDEFMLSPSWRIYAVLHEACQVQNCINLSWEWPSSSLLAHLGGFYVSITWNNKICNKSVIFYKPQPCQIKEQLTYIIIDYSITKNLKCKYDPASI